eukprot:1188081-Prorocentrum_minimum.AAC.4
MSSAYHLARRYWGHWEVKWSEVNESQGHLLGALIPRHVDEDGGGEVPPPLREAGGEVETPEALREGPNDQMRFSVLPNSPREGPNQRSQKEIKRRQYRVRALRNGAKCAKQVERAAVAHATLARSGLASKPKARNASP